MSGGTGSTLILRPHGLTAITFDLDASLMAAGSYVVDLNALRLGEEGREEMEYAQRTGAEGGDLVGVQNPLVPITFEVAAVHDSRAGMLEMVHDLRVALQAGGWLEYKPENLPGGASASYYAYQPSAPGGLKSKRRNRWDGPSVNEGGTVVYKTECLVGLMTYPFLTTDPDSPVTVVAATTIQNRDDGTGDNFVTIPAATLDGDSRALLQTLMRNLETGDYDDVIGVYVFPRVYGLTNYKITFEPGAVVVGATEWGNIADVGRASANEFQRLTPTSDDLVYRLQFQVANWTDFVGRHLLMIACRDNGGGEGDFEVRGGWSLGIGDVKDPTPWKTTRGEWLGEWQLFSLGEMEFPGTQAVGVEAATTPYYELEVFRNSGGTGTFDVDFFIAGPVDLRPLYVDCLGVLFLNDHRLLISNLEYPTQVAHIVDQATLALEGAVKPLGLLPLANCGKEATDGYRLYFLWERRDGTLVVNDDFAGYDANWQEISDCDVAWVNSGNTLARVEGSQAQAANIFAIMTRTVGPVDYSGWAGTDYFCCVMRERVAGPVTNDFEFHDGAAIYRRTATVPATWGVIRERKTDFVIDAGAPNWNSIDDAVLDRTGHEGVLGEWDNWRWSKKDPASAQPNDFGAAWNYFLAAAPWFVYTDAATRCAGNPTPVDATASGSETGTAEQLLLSNMVDERNIKMKTRAYAFQNSELTDSELGIVARCSDGTSGSEDCYYLSLSEDANTLTLYKYVAGMPTVLATVGFTVAAATWYWLGIECLEDTVTCYAHAAEADLWDNVLIEVTDTSQATGKCGFMIKDGMGRFDDAEVWAEDDRYNPQDEMSVEVKALLRSIHPHYE